MGRSAPVDPIMAARLAAEAAAAAKAAADAAARAAADPTAAGTAERLAAAAATSPIERAAAAAMPASDGSPTLAANDRPDGVDDVAGATTVTGGAADVAASLAPDLGALAAGSSLTSRIGLAADGSSRDDMLGTAGLGLPGLGDILSGSAGDAAGLAGAAPTVGTFSSGGGGIDRSSIMDGGFGSDVTLRQAWDHPILTGGKLLVDAVDAVVETVEDAADTVRGATSTTKAVVDVVYDYATDDSDSDSSSDSAGTESSGAAPEAEGNGDDWVRWNEAATPLGPKTQEEDAEYEYNLWLAQETLKAESDSNDDAKPADAGGTPSAEYHVQGDDDLSGNPYAGGYAGVLGAVTGHTGSSGVSPRGPSGGGTVVNPGSEGVAPAEKGSVDLSGAVAYGGVKDPPKPVDGPAVLDPSKLDAAPSGADAGATDPTDPNFSTAASAAYADDDQFGDQGGHGRGLGQGRGASGDEHGRNGSDGDSTDGMDDAS